MCGHWKRYSVFAENTIEIPNDINQFYAPPTIISQDFYIITWTHDDFIKFLVHRCILQTAGGCIHLYFLCIHYTICYALRKMCWDCCEYWKYVGIPFNLNHTKRWTVHIFTAIYEYFYKHVNGTSRLWFVKEFQSLFMYKQSIVINTKILLTETIIFCVLLVIINYFH